jgi:hypothetical protein
VVAFTLTSSKNADAQGDRTRTSYSIVRKAGA